MAGVAIVLGLAGAACASRPAEIPLQIAPRDLEMLAGNWSGSYSTAQRRHGLIDFRLDAAAGAAYGDVFMIADHATEPYAQFRGLPGGDPGPVGADRSQTLQIRFARIEDGRVQGSLTAYWDPDRHCQAVATFTGSVRDGSVRESTTIDGTFESVCTDGGVTWRGHWSVTREQR